MKRYQSLFMVIGLSIILVSTGCSTTGKAVAKDDQARVVAGTAQSSCPSSCARSNNAEKAACCAERQKSGKCPKQQGTCPKQNKSTNSPGQKPCGADSSTPESSNTLHASAPKVNTIKTADGKVCKIRCEGDYCFIVK